MPLHALTIFGLHPGIQNFSSEFASERDARIRWFSRPSGARAVVPWSGGRSADRLTIVPARQQLRPSSGLSRLGGTYPCSNQTPSPAALVLGVFAVLAWLAACIYLAGVLPAPDRQPARKLSRALNAHAL